MVGFVYGFLLILSFLFALRAAYPIAKRLTKKGEPLKQKYFLMFFSILIFSNVLIEWVKEEGLRLLGVADTFLISISALLALPMVLVFPQRWVPEEVQEILQDKVAADANGDTDFRQTLVEVDNDEN